MAWRLRRAKAPNGKRRRLSLRRRRNPNGAREDGGALTFLATGLAYMRRKRP